MYDNLFARTRTARRIALGPALVSALVTALAVVACRPAQGQDYGSPSVVRKIGSLSEKLELTTNTSRILTLDKNIPRVQVNNPELLAVTPLSATQVQISAKKAGVTQVNLWDDEGNIHTVDILIYGDARELEVALQTQFPHSSIKVYRYSESLVLKGFVDRPDYVSQIMRLAEDYAPKVINNISVGGVQQILLKVKVMEVSRTKLRRLGVDWAYIGGSGDFAVNSVGGVLSFDGLGDIVTNNSDTFAFGIVHNNSRFFGFLDALQQNHVAKLLSEPNILAVSGRPAQFQVGGETPILVPQSLGTTSIEYKPFGTQVDFLPIVLGNGNIRLEVRPRVSFLDPTNGIVLNDIVVPGFNVRQVDTAVEMQAGQTFALAGLIQERSETLNRGLPVVSDLPVIGVPFRKTEDEKNEIELLILVTPEFVDPMEAGEAPCGGPGYTTTNPRNCDLYCAGHVEVPAQCNPITGPLACGGDCCNANSGCQSCNRGHFTTEGVSMPGGVGYDDAGGPSMVTDQGEIQGAMPAPREMSSPPTQPMPASQPEELLLPSGQTPVDGGTTPPPSSGASNNFNLQPEYGAELTGPAGTPQYSASRPYSPPRQPVYTRNTSKANNRQSSTQGQSVAGGDSGLIGPVGYDVQ